MQAQKPQPYSCTHEIIEHMPGVAFRFAYESGMWRTLFVTKNISMYGYNAADFMKSARCWIEIVHPDDRAAINQTVGEYVSHGIDEFRIQYRLVDKKGDSVPVTEYSVLLRNEAGGVQYADTMLIKNTQAETGRRLVGRHYKQHLVLNDILMSLHSSDLEHALQIILERTGEYLNISRVALLKDNAQKTHCSVIYEWLNKDIPSLKEQNFVWDYKNELRETHEMLLTKGMRLVGTGEIPPEDRALYAREGLVATAMLAVYLNGEYYGFVSFDECVLERVWDEDTARFLKNISNLISVVLARQEASNQILLSQKTYQTVLDNMPFYVFAVELETENILFANKPFREVFGEAYEGRRVTAITGKYLWGRILEERKKKAPIFPETYCKPTKQWLSVHFGDVPWIDGKKVCLISSYDITEKKQYAQAVERLAFLDHLTGLPNSYRLENDLINAFAAAEACKQDAVMLFIDLDDFKIVNDCYGHDYGNEILKAFAGFLDNLFSNPNRVYRFGGDEFIVLLHPTHRARLHEYLDQLIARSKSPWIAFSKSFFCTLSVGAVFFPSQADTPTAAIKNADIAMYAAKRAGKNNYSFFEKAQEDIPKKRTHMEALLRRCMENEFEGFEVYYQPIIEARTGRITGAEALLRMHDGEKLVRPKEFMQLAEYLGFIAPIGEFVLKQAVKQCKSMQAAGHTGFGVTVNLSGKQIAQRNVLARIEDIIGECGGKRAGLILSVSEDVAIEYADKIIPMCERLRKMQIGVALSNFGGGRSSFLRMEELPVGHIRTSSIFMKRFASSNSGEFIKFISQLAHTMGKRVCVNGIETKAQYDFCMEIGVEELQGFYMYPPLKADALMRALSL